MKNIFLVILLTLFSFISVFGQEPNEKPEKTEKLDPLFYETPPSKFLSKLHYGGNVYFAFINTFFLDISPMAGLEINDKGTIAGLGAKLVTGNGQTAFGPKVFIRQPVWRTVFIDAEYELMNANAFNFYSFKPQTGGVVNPLQKKWEGSPLIGIGMYQNRNRTQGGGFISLMYNIGQTYDKGYISPYGLFSTNSPISVRFGYFL